MPRHIVLKQGEPVTTVGALFYVELATGATEGWELGKNIADRAEVSRDGRYIISGQRLLDTTTGATCQLEGVSEWAGAFSPNGRYFLAETPEGMDKVTSDACGHEREVLGLPSPGEDGTGRVWRYAGAAAWSPDGEALVVWGYSDPTHEEPLGKQHVYLVSPEFSQPTAVQLGDGQRSSGPVAWSPDGKRFALASGTTLAAVDLRGQVLWLTDIPGSSIANVRWSPDGDSMSVHAFPLAEEISGRLYPGRSPAVYALDARTGAIDFRLWGASACWGEVWTADGGWLIVVGERDGEFGWFVVAAEGATVRRLEGADAAFFVEPSPTNPDIAAFLGRPRYPDGTVGAVEGPLMSLDLTSGAARPVLRVSPRAQAPGWDPVHSLPRWLTDGRLVFFTGDGGHGGCEMGPARPNLEVQFPPFEADE